MNLIEKIIEEKINRYGVWPLTLFAILFIFLLSWSKDLIMESVKLSFGIPTILVGITLVIIWIVLLIALLSLWEITKERIIRPIQSLFRNKIFFIPTISKWIFQGSFKITGDSLEVTASDSGCLIRDYLYKDFVMNFNIAITNGGRAGVVFRAQDLENYLMLQIVLADYIDGSGTIIQDIIPHIRFLGDWESFNITSMFTSKPESYHPTVIKYHPGIPMELRVKGDTAVLAIESNGSKEEFVWNIPTHTEANIKNYLPKGVTAKIGDLLDGRFVPKIWFRNKYGRIGFRAHSWEKAVISNLKIEKI